MTGNYPQPGTREYDGIKAGVNKEGFESGGEDKFGGEVYIGTEKEIKEARMLSESKGKAENVESYLRLHRKMAVPSEEVRLSSEYFKPYIYGIEQKGKEYTLYYLDAKLNLISFVMDPSDISELNKGDLFSCGNDTKVMLMKQSLTELGFFEGDFKFLKQVRDLKEVFNIKEKKERERETREKLDL